MNDHAAVTLLKYGQVQITDRFWTARRELMRTKALGLQWEQLERTGCVDNFRVAAGEKSGQYRGWGFADSDLYKWLEAAAWVLGAHPDDQPLSACAEEVIALIRKVQLDDGYINTYYQIAAPARRYNNLLMKHELYCLGHLIEAGCTHRIATGRTDLFAVAVRCGDHICKTFGKSGNRGVPGHEEVEMALMSLYRETGERRYLETARFFLDQRGRPGVFRKLLRDAFRDLWISSPLVKPPQAPFKPRSPQAAETSVGSRDKKIEHILRGLSRAGTLQYFQMHEPLIRHTVAEGHSVRAMYLYAAAADLLLASPEPELRRTLERVWDNTITKRTYITGGMGSFPFSEGFGRDYELPNRSYTETCAAIGSVFFSQRMLQATGSARFAAQIETTLYNAILGCQSADGEKYFYSNPLVSRGYTERQEWYDVPCCPPNLARLFWSLEQYIYGHSENTVWVHQYIGSRASVSLAAGDVTLAMESGFPFDGLAAIEIEIDKPLAFSLRLRIPPWASGAEIKVNDQAIPLEGHADSYADVSREWKPGDRVSLTFPMDPAVARDIPHVAANRGRIAMKRGPLVYCVQGVDNPQLDVHSMTVETRALPDVETRGDIATLKGSTVQGEIFEAVPYYAWGNKGPTPMAVWLRAR